MASESHTFTDKRPTAVKIHEYQAKLILAQHGLPIPQGEVAFTPAEARKIAKRLGTPVVIKAQIHAGGRGKGGGVRVAETIDQVESIANEIIGMKLVTAQTGQDGRIVSRVLVEKCLEISRELYLGMLIDRSSAKPVIMASASGGVEIEKVAEETPDLLLKEYINPIVGLAPFQIRKLVFGLGLDSNLVAQASAVMTAMYKTLVKNDASLVEINPMVLTNRGQLLGLDAKVTLDDNAIYRHLEWTELRDLKEEEPLEVEASKYSLSYIRLTGQIGCMVNGAGLAMSTMDVIKLAGGEPANFLDVGGGASAEQVRRAFGILMSDPNVRVVLVNIFGGILRCDVLAKGVIAAVGALDVRVPMVIRMEGTNVEEGRTLLQESGLNFHTSGTMTEAAWKAVELSRRTGDSR